MCNRFGHKTEDCHPTAKASLAQAPGSATLEYAQRLATTIWEKHWKQDAPNWKPLDDVLGVLTQIDNMVAGMTRPNHA
jgi:hypothetical protein